MKTKCLVITVIISILLLSCSPDSKSPENTEILASFYGIDVKIIITEEATPDRDNPSKILVTKNSKHFIIDTGIVIENGGVKLNGIHELSSSNNRYDILDSQLKWGEENIFTVKLSNNDTSSIIVHLPNRFENVTVSDNSNTNLDISNISWKPNLNNFPTNAIVSAQKDTIINQKPIIIQRDLHFNVPSESSNITLTKDKFTEYLKIVKISLVNECKFSRSAKFKSVTVESNLKWFIDKEYLL